MLVVSHGGGGDGGGEEGGRCAGALVSPRSALTTASCARLRSGPLAVLAGTYLSGRASYAQGARAVASVVLPPGYARAVDSSGAVDDIAVLRLSAPFAASEPVRPILMAMEAGYERAGTRCNLVRAIVSPTRTQRRRSQLPADARQYPDSVVASRELVFTSAADDGDVWTPTGAPPTPSIVNHVSTRAAPGTPIADTSRGKQRHAASSQASPAQSNQISAHTPSSKENPTNSTLDQDAPLLQVDPTRISSVDALAHFIPTEIATGHYSLHHIVASQNFTSTLTTFHNKALSANISEGSVSASITLHKRSLDMLIPNDALTLSDWGTGLVCDGKLCGMLSRVATTGGGDGGGGAGCGGSHTLQSIARWRRFLDCAHDPGACDRLPCARYCREIILNGAGGAGGDALPTEPERPSRPAPLSKSPSPPPPQPPRPENSSPSSPTRSPPPPRLQLSTDDSEDEDESPGELAIERFDTKQLYAPPKFIETDDEVDVAASGDDRARYTEGKQPNKRVDENVENVLQRAREPSDDVTREGGGGTAPTRSPPPPMPLLFTPRVSPPASGARAVPAAAAGRRRVGLAGGGALGDFEPYRADFRAGEYGDNAADYRGGPEDYDGAGEGGRSRGPPGAHTSSGAPAAVHHGETGTMVGELLPERPALVYPLRAPPPPPPPSAPSRATCTRLRLVVAATSATTAAVKLLSALPLLSCIRLGSS